MSLQPSSLGRFWLGPQTAKGTAADTYYAFKANMVDVAPAQMFRGIGQLVGGSLLPGGTVKTAAWVGGAVVMPPPLDDYLGWLLYAFAGSVSSMDNGDSTYTHYFPGDADSTAPGKYLTARRKVPATSALYEQMQDCVPSRMVYGVTPGEYLSLRYEMAGRVPTKPDGSGWTYSAKNEDSVPIACKGHFELPDGTAIETATGVSLDLVNAIPDVGSVLVVGDYYPYDFPVLTRGITVTWTHLWENSDLYESLYYSGTSWTPITYSGTFEMEVQSPGYITGALPYKLTFYAQNIEWSCRPVTLTGGGLIELEVTGMVSDSDSGMDWYLALTNGTASYTWPT